VEAVRLGYEDVKAGRTRPAAEFLEELRESMACRVEITQAVDGKTHGYRVDPRSKSLCSPGH
jgi:hypothetical protein